MSNNNPARIDWNELSRRGLLVRINNEILHPLGLAIMREPETGSSPGALIASDGRWEYLVNCDVQGFIERMDVAIEAEVRHACDHSDQVKELLGQIRSYFVHQAYLQKFTCKGKGGRYELLGAANPSGFLRELGHGEIKVYRDIESGKMYYRSVEDFGLRMEAIRPN